MYSFAEKPFTINGVKSWIQCIDCFANESNEQDKVSVDRYHYHEYIEFLYALDTDMNVWLNGNPHHLNTGDLIIINSGELHNISFNKNSHYICIKFSLRVNEAEKLLLSTDRSITNIAMSCGFSSTSHFISRFKSHKGMTPGQLRRKAR